MQLLCHVFVQHSPPGWGDEETVIAGTQACEALAAGHLTEWADPVLRGSQRQDLYKGDKQRRVFRVRTDKKLDPTLEGENC